MCTILQVCSVPTLRVFILWNYFCLLLCFEGSASAFQYPWLYLTLLFISDAVVKVNTSATCCLHYSALLLRFVWILRAWGVLCSQVSVCLGGDTVNCLLEEEPAVCNSMPLPAGWWQGHKYGLGFNTFCLCLAKEKACQTFLPFPNPSLSRLPLECH